MWPSGIESFCPVDTTTQRCHCDRRKWWSDCLTELDGCDLRGTGVAVCLQSIHPVCLRSLWGAVGVLMITALRDASPPVLTLRFNQNLSVAPDLTAVDNHHVCHRHSQVRCASIFQLVSLTEDWGAFRFHCGCNIHLVDKYY